MATTMTTTMTTVTTMMCPFPRLLLLLRGVSNQGHRDRDVHNHDDGGKKSSPSLWTMFPRRLHRLYAIISTATTSEEDATIRARTVDAEKNRKRRRRGGSRRESRSRRGTGEMRRCCCCAHYFLLLWVAPSIFHGHFSMRQKWPKRLWRWPSGPSANKTRPLLGLFLHIRP